MSKEYHTVIELEHLDDFLNGSGDFNGLMVAMLMYTAHRLNRQEEFVGKFNFEVICYGWVGYYPAIGVEYLLAKDLNQMNAMLLQKLPTTSLKNSFQRSICSSW